MNPNRPELTVVIPNYNHARHLDTCLGAILSQRGVDFEAIVVDDASTDDSWDLIGRWVSREPRLRALRNHRNRGVTWTIHRAALAARAPYVYAAGADDEIRPGFLAKSMALLRRHPQAGLCCTAGHWKEAEGGLEWFMGRGLGTEPRYLGVEALVALGRAGKLYLCTHASIIRKDLLLAHSQYHDEFKWYADWWLNHACAFTAGVCYIPEPLAIANIHRDSYFKRNLNDAKAQRAVVKAIFSRLDEPRCRPLQRPMAESGALGALGGAALEVMLAHPRFWKYCRGHTLRAAVWLELQRRLKDLLPRPVAAFYLRHSRFAPALAA
jgi:glycosyltransferase involved in cell wall biosynthesis